jgi:hypothetical protein
VTPILIDHETDCIENIISLSFHVYKEHPNRSSYTSCALISMQVVIDSELETNVCEVNKCDLDKLERKNDSKHKHGNKIYVIERFIVNVL